MTDIIRFRKGETVQVELNAKDRGGAALDLTGATVTLVIGSAPDEAPIVQFTSPSVQVTITAPTTGVIDLKLSPTDLTNLAQGVFYFYTVLATLVDSTKLDISRGIFRLKPSIIPA